MLIDCDECQMQGTHHCDDCIVTVLMRADDPGDAIVFDAEEERAVRTMASVGLVPEIRMTRRPRAV
ncbi:MAG TPA: hypothetical protein VM840_03990 [Actinomycetota bacterium]|nr:hypothetical protein [Actinomycetota bacterium]